MNRRPLSRETVVAAAVTLAKTDGMRAVTMRRIGERLGVEAMSLYTYIDSKDDLLEQMFRATYGDRAVETLGSPEQYTHPADAWLVGSVRETLIGLAVAHSDELGDVLRLVLTQAGYGAEVPA